MNNLGQYIVRKDSMEIVVFDNPIQKTIGPVKIDIVIILITLDLFVLI